MANVNSMYHELLPAATSGNRLTSLKVPAVDCVLLSKCLSHLSQTARLRELSVQDIAQNTQNLRTLANGLSAVSTTLTSLSLELSLRREAQGFGSFRDRLKSTSFDILF